ncbi:MAG TPA: carboxypeptidase-like regulatory domain-containing protein [Myxococcus sp.]|nr:carboxypeptidase-like regulatory domain-containing protein [Myxococcus sp.]
MKASLQSGAQTRAHWRKVPLTGAEPPVALSLQGPHRLRGQVIDARGRPVRGAQVLAVRAEPEREEFSVTREGVDGAFAFDNLPDGELTLTAWAPEHEGASVRVRLPASGPLRLVLPRDPSYRVTGRVLDTKGRPVRAFRLDSTEVKHAGGRFSVSMPLYRDSEVVEVSAPGFAPRRLTVGPKRLALGDIRLGPGRTLTGRVETPEGRGLAGATVWCRWAGPPQGSQASACHGNTLPDGSLYLAHVPEEALVLELRHPDWPRTRLHVPAGVSEARVRLTPGLTLQGTVRDGRGRPLEAGAVHVTQDGEWHFGRIQPDGGYRLRVPPGRGTLQVLNLQGEPLTFEGTEGQTVRVDLVAPGGN